MKRLKIFEWLILLTITFGAPPLSAAIWQWSTTAATNATADPSINWAEGMSPSSVNDSARAMMSAIAAWRNDISAVNATAGTSTAYTLTTSEGVTQPPTNGQMIAFLAHVTNGTAPTLSVDGGTAYPIMLNGAAAPSATMILNTPYRVAWNTVLQGWLLEAGYGNPYSVPLGGIMWSTVSSPPNSSFIAPSGQCISTTTYAAYWVAMGSPASGACPGGQFAVIDMRGRVAAGLDTLNASAANRLTNSSTGCGVAFTSVGAVCTESQSTTLLTANLPAYTPAGSVSTPSISGSNGSVVATNGTLGNSVPQGGGSCCAPSTNTSFFAATLSSTTPTFTGTAQGGTSTAFSRVQPTIGLMPYLRIL